MEWRIATVLLLFIQNTIGQSESVILYVVTYFACSKLSAQNLHCTAVGRVLVK